MVAIYALTDDTPVIVVLYEHGPGSIRTRPSAATLIKETRSGQQPVHIQTTLRIEKLLLKILHMNAKHLSSSYAPPLLNNKMRHKYSLSFFLPITPLSMREVGSLNSDVGCAVCGLPSTSRCSGCQQAAYCSKDCQKMDWAKHKRECKNKSLAGGNWIDVDMTSPGYSEYTQPVNEFSVIGKGPRSETPIVKSAADWPPPNIYDDKPFVIKIMVPEPEMGFMPLMIYDRRRSVEFLLRIDVDPRSYEALLTTTRRSGDFGLRIFLYAKRTGHTKLSVCLNREPPTESVKW